MKILVIRLSAMGDAAMVVPVVEALRNSYPQAEITVLTRKLFTSFFLGIKDIKFVDFDPNGRHSGLKGLRLLSRELGSFDYVADMHDVIRTKILRKLLVLKGAKVSHIDKGKKAKEQLTRTKNKKREQLTPTIVRYHQVLTSLGLDVPMPLPYANTRRPLDATTQELCGQKQGRWIGIAPFAQHKGKIYPTEKMFEVARTLSAQPSTKLFIFGGGASEAAVAEQWQSELENTVSVIGKLKITEELELISNLDTIVCMDSSSMHMASLVGTPAVSIWGATHPYAGFMGFGQSYDNAVSLDIECRPCSVYGNKPCIFGDYRCLNNIEPQTIVDKVNKVTDETAI